jgi:signal transduction histidine kinase/PAS domain-containing protein
MKTTEQKDELRECRIQLKSCNEYTEILQNISIELIREDNIQRVFEKIADAAMQIMNSEYSSMQILHSEYEKRGKLQLLASRGFSQEAKKFWQWVSAEDAGSTCGEALRTGRRVIASNVRECDFMQGTKDLETYLQTGINAVQTTPLYSRNGKMLGMLSTHWREPYKPSEEELRSLDILARQAADLIEQKQFEEKLRESEERYRTLFEYMNDGFFSAEIVCNESGSPEDYVYLTANPAFNRAFNLKNQEIIGRRNSQVFKPLNCSIEIFDEVARTGKPTVFEEFFKDLNRYFLIQVFSPKAGQFACLAQDITERRIAEDKNIWDKEKAEILYEVTEKLLKSNCPQEIIEELCTRVMKFLKLDTFFNYLIDEDKMRLQLIACGGVPKEHIKEIKWIDLGVAVCGRAARDGCIIVTENIQSTIDERTKFIKSLGLRAYTCHPLMEQNKVIGTLSFGTKSKDTFSKEELSLIQLIVNQVSIGMHRMRAEQLLIRQQQLMVQAENEKRQALEKTLQMKDEFLSLISHEFRTPINVIYTAIQALNLVYDNEMSDKVKEYIKTIKQNTFRQLRLVNNLLDITRTNSGHIKINKRNIDIVLLTKSITESVYQYAGQKGVEISFVSSFQKKVIAIDDEKFERIILNLLSNAIKFTPRGKSVTVSLRRVKGSICIEVKDKGIGIPPDKIDLIFKRFGQVDSSLSRQAEGTGIGLSLVKNFVEALGGSISVKSKIGSGSNFTILLREEKVIEEQIDFQTMGLMDNRLVHVTNVEFSDIYL